MCYKLQYSLTQLQLIACLIDLMLFIATSAATKVTNI